MNIVKQCKSLFTRSNKKPIEDDVASCQSDNSDKNTSSSSTAQVVTDYLANLEHRFNKEYLHEGDSSTTWANVWITEEAILEANHGTALSPSLTSSRIRSYLMARKDRTLNFLWVICRDGPVLEQDELQTNLETFLVREESLLKLYLVSYIKCDVASKPPPLQ